MSIEVTSSPLLPTLYVCPLLRTHTDLSVSNHMRLASHRFRRHDNPVSENGRTFLTFFHDHFNWMIFCQITVK